MSVAIRPRDSKGRYAKASAIVPGSDTTQRAASATDQAMAAWWPRNTDPNTPFAFEQRVAVDRTRDLVTNNAYAAAAVDRRVAMTVGVELRYSARHELMAKRLGIKPEDASILATQIEAAWENWANDPLFRCDWEGEQNFGGLINLAERHHFVDGEALGVMRYEMDAGNLPPGWKWQTSLQLIDPDRLSNPIGDWNRKNLINGIETDGRRTVAYHFREAHPADPTAYGEGMRWERVEARKPWGRPVVLHLRTKTRAGQKRGVSRFVSCMRMFKQLDKYTEAELSSALLNAIFGGTIETSKTPGEATDALGLKQLEDLGKMRAGFYKGNDPRLSNGARWAVLAPGDKATLNAVPRHVASFQGFITTTLQAVAGPLGLTGSQLTMDFSKTNFSSWRGEMLQVWRDVLQGRELAATQFANLALLCVIEEAIDKDEITPPAGCPGLYENAAGWLAGRWIGPSRGTIDPGGEVDGAVKRIAALLSTHEDEAMELGGGDHQAIAGQVEFERNLQLAKGLKSTAVQQLTGMPQPGAPAPVEQPENKGKGNVAEPAPEDPEEE